jgi:hypothetical protein
MNHINRWVTVILSPDTRVGTKNPLNEAPKLFSFPNSVWQRTFLSKLCFDGLIIVKYVLLNVTSISDQRFND